MSPEPFSATSLALALATTADAARPLLPGWVVLPMGAITLVILATHVHLVRRSKTMPESRRRIRTANGVLMMCIVPLVAYAFGIATRAEPRIFTMVWMAIIGMLAMVLLLAWVDAINSWRLHRTEQAATRAHIAALRAKLSAEIDRQQASAPDAQDRGGNA